MSLLFWVIISYVSYFTSFYNTNTCNALKLLEWIVTLKNEISLLKIENWVILFQNWLNFRSLEGDPTPKNLENIF